MAAGKWEDLREASFRNVPFFLVDDEGTSGRRAIPRAFPKKETGWTEDNGAVLGQQQINGKLLGRDYQRQLNALLDALNTPGPGELIHPWFGIQRVQVGKVSHRLSTEDGGIAFISFEVFEAGSRLFPAPRENTREAVLNAADAVMKAFENGDYFTALDGLGDMADAWLDDLQSLVLGLPAIPDTVTRWLDRAGRLQSLAGILVAKPGELVRTVTELSGSIRELTSDPLFLLRTFNQLRQLWSGSRARYAATRTLSKSLPVVVSSPTQGALGWASSVSSLYGITPSAAMQTNMDDFRLLVMVTSLVTQVQGVATMTFTTSQEALTVGERLAQDLSEQAGMAVENGQRDLWRTLRDLRFVLVRDVQERAALLPERRFITPATTTTAALLAWRETGNTENRDDIVSRNRLRDPAFIPPFQKIEIIDR